MLGHIKIIGGKYKGKKIKVIASNDLRPTPNRLRETLFNILQHDIKLSKCLDGFAGTGALGLEAYSRGAKHVTLIDSNLQVFKQLLENTRDFPNSDIECININCLDYLKQTTKTFDIIFLDPPFKENFWLICCQTIIERNLLNDDGILYLESPSPISIETNRLNFIRTGVIGDVHYTLLQKNSN
jgi:16S rRNA (guanine966-N2)-methyltransferase